MKVDKKTRDTLLELQKDKKIYLEGNILKVIESDENDDEFKLYLDEAIAKDKSNRKQRLEITKQVQKQNNELLQWKSDNESLTADLVKALEESEKSKEESEMAKNNALNDLDILQKKSQTELINMIVKIALIIIIGVGLTTTILYLISILTGKETQVIGAAWSNMFGILLTNAFSIVGTIMGVKYATEKK